MSVIVSHINDRAAVNLEKIPVVQLPLANRFYADNGLRLKCGRHEQVYCLRSSIVSNTPIIAAVRFVPAGDYFIMRNLCVASHWRRQGLARLLMRASLPQFNANIFCFSFGHLEIFYQSVGFLTLDPERVPVDIAKAYQSYSQKFPDLVVMGLFNG